MTDKKTLLGIKVISIVYFICFLFLLVFSIMLFFKFNTLKDMPDLFPFLQNSNGIGIGIITAFISISFLIVSIGLLKKKQWARVISIIFTLIGLIGSITSIISSRWLSLINLAIYSLIGWYLTFNKKVKEAFL